MKTNYSYLLSFLLVFLFTAIKAQVQSVVVGINGLTCSACSFSTEKSIRKLDFVDSVYMQLDKNIATIYVNPAKGVSLDLLAQRVVDAGFSVRSVFVILNVPTLKIRNDYCYEIAGVLFHFVKINGDVEVKENISIKIIGAPFMPKKEFRQWQLYCNTSCVPEGVITNPVLKTYYATLP